MAKKKTMKVRVEQEYIDKLLAHPPRRGFEGLPDEVLQRPPESQAELEMRACFAEAAALCKAAYDKEMDILEQYHTYGFAEVEVEDSDDEGTA